MQAIFQKGIEQSVEDAVIADGEEDMDVDNE
jgi:hypothetical protein